MKEAAPRPAAERLSVKFETDDLVVDHTLPRSSPPPPSDAAISSWSASTAAMPSSLLDYVEVSFNNGDHQTVEQPVDSIRDGREETFVLEEPLARVTGASAVEVTLYDSSGNGATRRLELGRK